MLGLVYFFAFVSQKLSVVLMFTIELVLPWFIFGPRVLRYIAFGGITLLMVLIAATGNYNFFNLHTFVLALTLLDDRAWPQYFGRRIRSPDQSVLVNDYGLFRRMTETRPEIVIEGSFEGKKWKPFKFC